MHTRDVDRIALNTKKFKKYQKEALNTIVGEIIPRVTVDNLHGPVQRPFNHKSACSRTYFLDSPGGKGNPFTFPTMQAILNARKHSVIAVSTSAVAASFLEDGQTARSVLKIPIPIHADSIRNISMESKIAKELRQASLILRDEIVMCARY